MNNKENKDPEKNLEEKAHDGWGWKWIEAAEDMLDAL